jgi:hypothetical protein
MHAPNPYAAHCDRGSNQEVPEDVGQPIFGLESAKLTNYMLHGERSVYE